MEIKTEQGTPTPPQGHTCGTGASSFLFFNSSSILLFLQGCFGSTGPNQAHIYGDSIQVYMYGTKLVVVVLLVHFYMKRTLSSFFVFLFAFIVYLFQIPLLNIRPFRNSTNLQNKLQIHFQEERFYNTVRALSDILVSILKPLSEDTTCPRCCGLAWVLHFQYWLCLKGLSRTHCLQFVLIFMKHVEVHSAENK